GVFGVLLPGCLFVGFILEEEHGGGERVKRFEPCRYLRCDPRGREDHGIRIAVDHLAPELLDDHLDDREEEMGPRGDGRRYEWTVIGSWRFAVCFLRIEGSLGEPVDRRGP